MKRHRCGGAIVLCEGECCHEVCRALRPLFANVPPVNRIAIQRIRRRAAAPTKRGRSA